MKVYDIVLLQNMSGVFVMKKNTILVVEDMSINRASLVAILSDKYDIIEAVNGEDALRIMCENPGIDLILTDIMMPRMNGREATAHIRNSGKRDADSIVIVAMTADVFQADLHKTSKSGMDYHLSKPFEKKQMMDILFKTFGWRFEQEQ